MPASSIDDGFDVQLDDHNVVPLRTIPENETGGRLKAGLVIEPRDTVVV